MKFDPEAPLGKDFKKAVQASVDRFIATQADLLAGAGRHLDLIWEEAHRFTQGGKHIRPGFCYWGFVAAAPQDDETPKKIMDVAASLDLLHVSALMHDDFIDSSDTRRGGPSAHRAFEAHHVQAGWLGDSAHFGAGASILLGDLFFAWSVSMVEQSGLSAERLKRARPYLDSVRSEVLAGQYLDLLHQATPSKPEDLLRDAELIMDFKTAKYTVARPAQIGAALAMASDVTLEGLGRFGTNVGRAFQMRDDLLGMFGDPKVTGKPAGDDLREGKKTVLVGYAMRDASTKDAAKLAAMLGDPSLTKTDLAEARRILTESGAVECTEKAIEVQAAKGMRTLHRLDLSEQGTFALMSLAHAAVERVA
ncbi:MAG: polyprenyl synthetase family protein [Propionibacteriaceae bacterium]|jgi:geranylgeranyl diphosphate synthase type I|nr:polyprenyl synthetase family protein [Propionibacteriaceae bacterium]